VVRGGGQLAKLQSALAALLMEQGRLDQFRADPARYATSFGLTGDAAKLLAGLPAEGAAYFASRRVIDRFHYLKGDLPRSVAAIDGAVGLAATYFADVPYAKEDPRAEVTQFRAWAGKAAKSGRIPAPLGDLAQVEAGGMLLMDEPHAKAPKSAKLRRAPGVALLALRHDPDDLLHGDPLAATKGVFPTALAREPDDVEVYKLDPVAAALLRLAEGKGTPDAAVRKLAAKHGEAAVKASLRDLRKLKLLAPG
jgi:hypothetical protein